MKKHFLIAFALPIAIFFIFEVVNFFENYASWKSEFYRYSEWNAIGKTFCEISLGDAKKKPPLDLDDFLPDRWNEQKNSLQRNNPIELNGSSSILSGCDLDAPPTPAASFFEHIKKYQNNFYRSHLIFFALTIAIICQTILLLYFWHKELNLGWKRISIAVGISAACIGGLLVLQGKFGDFDPLHPGFAIAVYSYILGGPLIILGLRFLFQWIRDGFLSNVQN